MSFWSNLRSRRIVQILLTYLAGGWVAVEAIDQFVDRGVLPEIVYPLALVLFISGIPASLIIGWYHGEKGNQRATTGEVLMLGLVLLGGLTASVFVYRAQQRPATAADLAGELDPHRIAVLYFEDQIETDSLDFLTSSLTEGLIERLGNVGALHVVSESGSRLFQGEDVSRDSIARALNVGTLIGGTVEQNGDRIRVTARLMDGSSGALVERTSFELPVEEMLAVHDSLSTEIARTLRRWLGEEVQVRQQRADTENLAAWTLVQRAENAMKEADSNLRHERVDQALEHYSRADSLAARAGVIDTTWSAPPILRADIAHERSWLVHDAHEALEWLWTGIEHANRALRRAPRSADALAVRGLLRYRQYLLGAEHDPARAKALLAAARQDLERAVRRDPTQARAYSALSHLYLQEEDKHVVDALLAARQAYEQDAFLRAADALLWRLYSEHYDLQQFQQAKRWCEEGRQRFPQDFRFVECRLWLMTMPQARPDVEEAWNLLEQMRELVPEPQRDYRMPFAKVIVGGIIGRAGMEDSARAVLRRAREEGLQADPHQEILAFEAAMRVLFGDEDEAVDLLKRYEAANPGHFRGGTSAWWWQPLQDHEGFKQLVGTGG